MPLTAQQKNVLAALYAHWQRRAEAVGPERAASWYDMQHGMRETLSVLGLQITPVKEFPCWTIEEAAHADG